METPANWWISSLDAPTTPLTLPSLSAMHVPMDTCSLAMNASKELPIALNTSPEPTFALNAQPDSLNPLIGAVVLQETFLIVFNTTVLALAFNAMPISQDFPLTEDYASILSNSVQSTTPLPTDAKLVSPISF
jgi:hypothetical protein